MFLNEWLRTSMNNPLRLLDIFKATITQLWWERKVVGGLLILVVFVNVSVDWLFFTSLRAEENSWIYLVFVIQALVYTLFSVRVHRLILGVANPVQGVLSWSRRETIFFGWFVIGVILFFIAGFTVTSAFVAAIAVAIPYRFSDSAVAIMALVASLPAAYLFARLVVLLPAVAIDQKQSIAWAWALTKGNGWRMVLIFWALPMSASVLVLDNWFISPLGKVALNSIFGLITALEVALLSTAFRALGGMTFFKLPHERVK